VKKIILVLILFLMMGRGVEATNEWGSIVNSNHQSEKIVSTLFFAGPPNPGALPNYTRHPSDNANNLWTDESIQFSLNQMKQIGINTVKVSYWGHDGETDRWATTLLFANKDWRNRATVLSESEIVSQATHFFQLVDENQLMFSPLIEVSPANPFYEQFPGNTGNMVDRIVWLVNNFGDQPGWLKVYDKNGVPRLAVWLIDTVHSSPINPNSFATGLDIISTKVEQATGKKVGLIIDPTPLPPYGSVFGPDPTAISKTQSVLAVNPFNITSQGAFGQAERRISEDDRLAYAESVVKKWSTSPIPFITTLLPGYDAHIVFPSFGIYGFTDVWLNKQQDLLLKYSNKGISFDVWNGYTEGYEIVPTVEEGDRIYQWAKGVIGLINVPANIMGDYDGDGDVDLVDFGIWKGKYLAGNSTLVEFGVWKRGYLK